MRASVCVCHMVAYCSDSTWWFARPTICPCGWPALVLSILSLRQISSAYLFTGMCVCVCVDCAVHTQCARTVATLQPPPKQETRRLGLQLHMQFFSLDTSISVFFFFFSFFCRKERLFQLAGSIRESLLFLLFLLLFCFTLSSHRYDYTLACLRGIF